MKHSFKVITLTFLVIAIAIPAFAQLNLPRVSQKATVTQTVGLTDLSVVYSRPGVKGRTVWGDLVPYGQVWRTGANEATKFTTSDDVMINGQKLAAGSYALATIPGKDEWTIAFNTQADLWGAYEYDEKKDALRVKVKPQAAPHQEWFQISFDEVTPSSATMVIAWDKVAVPMKIDVDVNTKALANINAALASAKADDWRTPFRGADFAFNNNVAEKESWGWVEQSLKVQENLYNLTLKAKMLARDGKKADAIKVAEKAIEIGKKATPPADTAPTERLLAEWKK